MNQLQILELWKQIKETLQQTYQDIGEAYTTFDKNQSEEIEYTDFIQVLQETFSISDESIIKSLFEFLNASNSGAITLEEFEEKWESIDALINQQKFQQTKIKEQPLQTSVSIEKSAQHFSDLFKSNASGQSPNKYINVQGDFQINYFQQTGTPSKKVTSFLDNPKIISPNKPSILGKLNIQQDRIREMQNRITAVFQTKLDRKNSTPKLKKEFDSYLNILGLGKTGNQKIYNNNNTYTSPIQIFNRRQYSNPQNTLDLNLFRKPSINTINNPIKYQFFRRDSGEIKEYKLNQPQRWSFRNNTSPSRSQDRIQLFQNAFQFEDRKYAHKQSFSFNRTSPITRGTNWFK